MSVVEKRDEYENVNLFFFFVFGVIMRKLIPFKYLTFGIILALLEFLYLKWSSQITPIDHSTILFYHSHLGSSHKKRIRETSHKDFWHQLLYCFPQHDPLKKINLADFQKEKLKYFKYHWKERKNIVGPWQIVC